MVVCNDSLDWFVTVASDKVTGSVLVLVSKSSVVLVCFDVSNVDVSINSVVVSDVITVVLVAESTFWEVLSPNVV